MTIDINSDIIDPGDRYFMNTKDFGSFITQLRKENGYTQKELAEMLNITDKAVSRWETGKNYPDIEMFEKIGTALNVSVNELISCKKIPKEKIAEESEKNIVKAIKKNKKQKQIFTLIVSILVIISLSVTCIMIQRQKTQPIYHEFTLYSNTYSTIFSEINSLIKAQPEAKGEYELDNMFCIMNTDKALSRLYFSGTTSDNGRYFYTSIWLKDDKTNMLDCFVGEDKDCREIISGLTIAEALSIFDSLDFEQIPDISDKNDYIFALNGLYHFKNEKISDLPDSYPKYIIENNIMRKTDNQDVLNAVYCQFSITPLSGDEPSAIIYYKK